MSAYNSDCPPLDACGPCGTLPSGFVRLRYFFGKRMGVADFVDEQRYHSSKLRFHNQRLHGAGVLCGLGVTRQSTTDVMLRVSKGAALDACGREIVVAYDQCIDLDSWFQRELDERREIDSTWPASSLDASGNLPLVVAIRYRDCATAPEPAPRDTCSCDAAGCDFGRVREEFELELFTADDPEVKEAIDITPPRAQIEHVVGHAVGSGSLARGLAVAAAMGCPEPSADGWLRVASFTATLATVGSDLHVTNLGPIGNEATLLAQSALLQDLLVRLVGAQLEGGALNEGPEALALSIEADATPNFQNIFIDLSGPLMDATVPTGAFTLSRLVTTGATPGWVDVACETTFVAAASGKPDRLQVRVDNTANDLEKDGLYRLAIDPTEVPPSAPMVDDEMRPFRPLRGVFQFSIDKPGTALVLVDAPYAR
jgi:hypothetical protein